MVTPYTNVLENERESKGQLQFFQSQMCHCSLIKFSPHQQNLNSFLLYSYDFG